MNATDLRDTVNEPPIIIPEVLGTTTIRVGAGLPVGQNLTYRLVNSLDNNSYVDIYSEINYTAADRAALTNHIAEVLELVGYTCNVLIATFDIEVTAPEGSGSSINGKFFFVGNPPQTNSYLQTSPVFSGGVDESETHYATKLNAE